MVHDGAWARTGGCVIDLCASSNYDVRSCRIHTHTHILQPDDPAK
jgi:hypothetical protein